MHPFLPLTHPPLPTPDTHAAALLEAATGRPVSTLDTWLLGRRSNAAVLARASVGADISLVDGGGGPLDGAVPAPRRGGREALQPLVCDASDDAGRASAESRAPSGDAASDDDAASDTASTHSASSDAGDGSAAQLAAWLGAPLALMADGGAACRGLAALVKGVAALLDDVWADCGGGRPPPPGGPLAGVILNRAPSDGAARWLGAALAGARVGAPVWGALPADGAAAGASAPTTLPPPRPGTPAGAAAAGKAAALGALVGLHIDVGAALAAARRAAPVAPLLPPPRPPTPTSLHLPPGRRRPRCRLPRHVGRQPGRADGGRGGDHPLVAPV